MSGSGRIRSNIALARTRQTAIIPKATAYLVDANDDNSPEKIRLGDGILHSLKSNLAEFKNLDDQWNTLLDKIADTDKFDAEYDIYKLHAVENPDKAKVPYKTLMHDLDKAIGDVESKVAMCKSDRIKKESTQVQPQGSTANQIFVMNTPHIDYKKNFFSGNPSECKAFLDDFDASVGSKPIPDVQKLSMLKDRLKGEAYDAVKMYNTNDGYAKALDKLKTRFGRKEDAVADLRRKIRVPCRNKSDYGLVRKAFDEYEYLITSLESYGINIDDDQYFEYLENKLPEEVLIRISDIKRNLPDPTTYTVTSMRKDVDTILLDLDRCRKAANPYTWKKQFQNYKTSYNPKTVATVTPNKNNKGNGNSKPQSQRFTKKVVECVFCEGPHFSDDCPVDKTFEEAREIAKEKRLCYKCYIPNHKTDKCARKLKCKKCGGTHHSINCKPRQTFKTEKKNDAAVCAANRTSKKFDNSETLLMTHEVELSHPHDPRKTQKVLAFIDPGSQINLVDKDLSEFLRLPISDKVMECRGATGESFTLDSCYSLNIRLENGSLYPIDAFGTEQMVGQLSIPKVEVSKLLNNLPKNTCEPLPISHGDPKLLLSMKVFEELVLNNRMVALENGFTIIFSKIGKLVCGDGQVKKFQKRPISPVVATLTSISIETENCSADNTKTSSEDSEKQPDKDDVIAQEEQEKTKPVVAQIVEYDYTKDPRYMWDLELMGIMDNPNADEKRLFLQRFLEKVFQDENGRIFTALPFDDESDLGSNYSNCYRRCSALSKRFLKDPGFAELYKNCVEEFHKKEFIEKMDASVVNESGTHFMPHSIVITPGKTTKARLVFDGSCVTERGVSLNQKLLIGDNRLPSLVGIILRARVAEIVVCSDVEKAFLQIYLVEESKKFVRFMFPKDITKPFSVDNMIIYQFKVVPFGLGCSPNLLAHAIEYHLNKYAGKHPEFANLLDAVLYSTYVDNVALASKTVEDAIAQNERVKAAFAAGSMNLRGQVSTHPEVNKHFYENSESFNFLGHELLIETDSMIVGWKKLDTEKAPKTKRALLSFCASLFDLMGVLEPVRLPIKLLIRKAWNKKMDWNSLMDSEIIEEAKKLYEERVNFTIKLVRKIFKNTKFTLVELHVFGDASALAYGCVAYIRCLDENNQYQVRFIFAKSRLSPLNPVATISKLELLALALANMIAIFLKQELSKVLIIAKIYLWSDSTTSIYWVHNPEGKGRFITNRALKIKNSDVEIRHVPGILNPADRVSRGCSPVEFESDLLWLNGPEFLKQPENFWPPQPELKEFNEREEAIIAATVNASELKNFVIHAKSTVFDARKFKTWESLTKANAFILKFIALKSSLFRQKLFKDNFDEVTLWKKAHQILIQQIQHSVQLSEKRVNELDLYCENGIWKKYCKVKSGDDPVYLADCPEVRLFIMNIHESLNHGSPSMILAELNQLYYLPKARTVIKSTLRRNCMGCRKTKAVPFALPIMNDLPQSRTGGKPFEATGVDLAGPFKVKYYANGEVVSHWIVLFTCFTSRAVHLELVSNISGEAFIDALTRFASRRGMPSFLYSDNGTNFRVTAATVIPKWICQDDPNVLNYCTSKLIKWKFIPEKAPWVGGLYEAMIKLVKRNIKVAVGRKQLFFDKMCTLLCQIEAWINSRPLTYISEDANQIILRPIDFIAPFVKPGVPDIQTDYNDPDFNLGGAHENLIALWTQNQKRLSIFKKGFNNDYLKMLRDRSRHHNQTGNVLHRNPRIGEIVIISDEDDKIFWKLGIIVEVIESSDNRIRAAKVKTPNGRILQRPVNHLFPLEVDDFSMENVTQAVKAANVKKLQLCDPEAFVHKEADVAKAVVEDSVPHVPVKSHPMKTRQDSKRASTSLLLTNPVMLFIVCLIASLASVSTTPCMKPLNTLSMVYYPLCAKNGYAVYEEPTGFCWTNIICPRGMLTPSRFKYLNALCEDASQCICPSWTEGCTYRESNGHFGNSTISNHLVKHGLNALLPEFCSLNPSPSCSSKFYNTKFMQIQLEDGSLHYIKNTHLIHHEAHDASFKCFIKRGSKNDTTGPKEYCSAPGVHCNYASKNVCVPSQIEDTYVLLPEGTVRIKSWGLVPVKVYGELEIEYSNWTTSCDVGTLQVKGGKSGDVLQVEFFKQIEYAKIRKETTVSLHIPRKLLMIDQNVTVTLWRNGYKISVKNQMCFKTEFCEQINCYFCPERLANHQCHSWILLIPLSAFTIIIILILIELCYCITFKKRGQRAYLLRKLVHGLTNKQKINVSQIDEDATGQEIPTNTIVVTDDVPVLPYVRFNSVLDNATIVFGLFVIFITLTQVYGASETISFQAKNHVCTRYSSGRKSCKFNNVAHFVIQNQNEISIDLEDDEGKLQSSINFKVTPVAICQRTYSKYSRLTDVRVYSSKRCPTKGSCIDRMCEHVISNTSIPELTIVNGFPGVTRCTSSCASWGCGCFWFTEACTFYKYYAIPKDSKNYEMFSCRRWTFGADIEVIRNYNHKSETKKVYVEEGTSVNLKSLKLSLSSVRTSETMAFKTFITDGTRIAVSDDKANEAMKILKCKTLHHAQNFDCNLDENTCNCLPAGEGVNCLCKQNHILKSYLDDASFPNETLHIKLEDHFAFYQLEDAVSDLVIETEQLEVVSQVDYSNCTMMNTTLQGCINCISGAVVSVRCSSDMGHTLGRVTCNPFSFSVLCDTNTHVYTFDLNETHNLLHCTLSCPANTVFFNLSGILHFVHESFSPLVKDQATSTVNWIDAVISFGKNLLDTKNYLILILILIIVVLLK